LPRNNIQTIVRAVFEMAKNKVGAIIVLPGEYPLDDLVEGGFPLNGQVTAAIILSIFDSSSPGHDGAILIEGSEIKMFGLHLPLAREFTEYRRLGTRHRAGAGITERTDAMAIIVSEERGEVSVSLKGILTKIATPEELTEAIAKFTGADIKDEDASNGFVQKFISKNLMFKILALVLALSMWFFSTYRG
jgi:DNA integrity scanning protein DisA with diadenylate cyclase activity